MNPVRYWETAYYGIYVQEDNGTYTLISDNDDEEHIGLTYPTDAQITTFRNRIMR